MTKIPAEECDELLAEECDELRQIFLEDDTEKLVAFLASERGGSYRIDNLIKTCMRWRAKKCTLFLIKGEVYTNVHDFMFGVFYSALSDFCDPEICNYLFPNSGGIKFANTRPFRCPLPLYWVLGDLRLTYPLLTWTPGESLVKLLILLCDPQLKKRLDCLRLLVDYTRSRVTVAINFASNGGDIELAALLLVAPRSVLRLLKSRLTKSLLSSTKDMNGIASQAILGKHAYPSGFGLIDIFDKAGDSLKKFYNSMPEDISSEDLIKGVAKILIEDAKISISEDDVDVAGILSVEPQMMSSIHEYLGIKPKECIDKIQKPMFRSVNSADYLYLHEPDPSMVRPSTRSTSHDQIKRFINARSSFLMGKHLYSTMAFQSPRISTNSKAWFTLAPTSTLRGMASLAMRLKRSIKFRW